MTGPRPEGPAPVRRVAVLSTYPPAPCGIGSYAQQQAERLEEEGVAVDRLDLAPLQQGGWRLHRGSALRRLLRRARAAPELVVHHQLWMYRDDTRRGRVRAHFFPLLAMLWLVARNGRRTEMVVHEHRHRLYKGPGAFLQYPYSWLLFHLPRRLVFHTQVERAEFERRFHRRRGIGVREHGADFRLHAPRDRAAARRRLGLPADEALVLCIGFYKEHKGFRDLARAVSAMQAARQLPPGTRLRIVTSVQDERDVASVQDLEALRAETDPAGPVTLHEGFVSDEGFDLWLAAADIVALPYRAIYSSGVAARARLVGRPLLVSDVGGLPEQAGAEGRVYRDGDELRASLLDLVRRARSERASP